MTKTKLTPDQLCRRTDPETFSFETTADLPAPANHLGQERAVEAIEFGIAMKRPGYCMYVHRELKPIRRLGSPVPTPLPESGSPVSSPIPSGIR